MFSNSCVRLLIKEVEAFEQIELVHAGLGILRIRIQDDSDLIPLETLLDEIGFSIISDPEIELVEKAKTAAVELIWYANNINSLVRNSDYISDKLQQPYDKISRIFSQHCGLTLERFILLLKMEKIKEMLLSKEYSLSEISFLLDYSSVQYLSRQFKQLCGCTVSEYLENPELYPRKALEDLIEKG
jgi:hypothetical protein